MPRQKTDSSPRKSFNVSLQKQKNADSVNPILQKWEEEGVLISDKVCESIVLRANLEQSVGINKLLNTYELIQKTLLTDFQEPSPEYWASVEKVFQSVVSINGGNLSEFLIDPLSFAKKGQDMPIPKPAQSEPFNNETSYEGKRTGKLITNQHITENKEVVPENVPSQTATPISQEQTTHRIEKPISINEEKNVFEESSSLEIDSPPPELKEGRRTEEKTELKKPAEAFKNTESPHKEEKTTNKDTKNEEDLDEEDINTSALFNF